MVSPFLSKNSICFIDLNQFNSKGKATGLKKDVHLVGAIFLNQNGPLPGRQLFESGWGYKLYPS